MSNPPKYIIYFNSQRKCLESKIKVEGEDSVCTYQYKAQIILKEENYTVHR